MAITYFTRISDGGTTAGPKSEWSNLHWFQFIIVIEMYKYTLYLLGMLTLYDLGLGNVIKLFGTKCTFRKSYVSLATLRLYSFVDVYVDNNFHVCVIEFNTDSSNIAAVAAAAAITVVVMKSHTKKITHSLNQRNTRIFLFHFISLKTVLICTTQYTASNTFGSVRLDVFVILFDILFVSASLCFALTLALFVLLSIHCILVFFFFFLTFQLTHARTHMHSHKISRCFAVVCSLVRSLLGVVQHVSYFDMPLFRSMHVCARSCLCVQSV